VTITTGSIAAGWYRDPAGSSALRWWDGQQWTDHLQQPAPVAPVAVVPTPPAVAVPPVGYGNGYPGTGYPANGYGQPGYVGAAFAPVARLSNSIAWFALIAGVVAILAIALKFLAPSFGLYLPVFGITAIISSLRAIARYRRGTVTVLWAPIVGLVLGTIAEFILVVALIAGALVPAGTSLPAPGSATDSQRGQIGPASDGINYSMGQGRIQYEPDSVSLADVAAAEAGLVAALHSDYAAGDYPATLTPGPNGAVVAPDGRVLGDFLQTGWYIDYRPTAGGNFMVEMTSQETSEVSVYYSNDSSYWAWCSQSDATCRTASPVAPTTSDQPTLSNNATA
jgi:hypothetical protein